MPTRASKSSRADPDRAHVHRDAAPDRVVHQLFEFVRQRTVGIRSMQALLCFVRLRGLRVFRDFVGRSIERTVPASERAHVDRVAVGVDRHGAVLVGSEHLPRRRRGSAPAPPARDGRSGWLRPALTTAICGCSACTNAGVLDVRLPWCGTLTTRSARGRNRRATSRSTALPMSPVSSTDTSRQRSSSTIESSFRTFCRSQSAARGWRATTSTPSIDDAIAALDVRPARAGRLRRHAQRVERLEARHRNALPDLARPELAQHRRGAADVIRIAVRQRERSRAAGTPASRSTGATTRSPMSNDGRAGEAAGVDEQRRAARKATNAAVALADVEERDVQPAVAARGDQRARVGENPERRATAIAPRRATRRSSPALRVAVAPHGATADAPAPRVVDGDRDPRRRRDAIGQRRREPDQIRRPHQAGGADVRDPAGRRRAGRATPARAARPPCRRSARRAISGIARKFSARPAKVTRENTSAPTGNSSASAATEAANIASDAAATREARNRRATLRFAARVDRRDAGTTTRIASVAPKVRTNAGSATDSGSAATSSAATTRQRVQRRAALIDARGRRSRRPPSASRDRPTRRRRPAARTASSAAIDDSIAVRPSQPARRNAPSSSPARIAMLPPEIAITW